MGVSMMAKALRRDRSPDWDDLETILLAKLKREAFHRGEEGSHVWHEISRSIFGRSADQCRERWDTLVKVYSKVQVYCTQTGREHEDLNDAELASMKLATTYGRDWYIIVQDVCGHRKRKERRHRDRAAVTVSKRSRTPVMKTLPTARPAATGSVITSLESDCENNTIFQSRETLDLKNHVGQVALSTDPLEDVRETEDVTVKTAPEVPDPSDDGTTKSPPEIEYAESEPAHSGLPDECPDDAQCNGAEIEAEVMAYDRDLDKFDFEEYKPPSPIPGNIDLSWVMSRRFLSTPETIAPASASTVSEGTISRPSSDNSILEALEAKFECLDIQAASMVIELGINLCCRGCVTKLRKKIDKVDGIQKVEFKYDCDKVIVTARADPEVVLKHAQMAKKEVVLLSPKKLIAPKS